MDMDMESEQDLNRIRFCCAPDRKKEITDLLLALRTELRRALGDSLEGLYLYGSLIWGDFDVDASDIDLLAVLTEPVETETENRLRQLHADLVSPDVNPGLATWDDRIEVQYAARSDLLTFRDHAFQMAVISPGEPLHRVRAGAEWTINWYFVQTHGASLFGPSTSKRPLTDPVVSTEEFLESVRASARDWTTGIDATVRSRSYQGYAVLTLCRTLYTLTFHRHVSKRAAAEWAKTGIPQYADLIEDAWNWRTTFRDTKAEPDQTFPMVKHAVLDMIRMAGQLR